METSTTVKSLSKAISLLDALVTHPRGMSLSQLSETCGYPKSTVHALLSTLRDKNLVRQEASGRYALGIRLFEYGCAVSRGLDINAVAKPYLQTLSSQTGATAVITLIGDDSAVSFDYALSESGVQVMPEIGEHLPLHATSQGMLLLSSMTDAKVKKLLKEHGTPSFTPHTASTNDAVLKRLSVIRNQGYSVEDGEYKIGLRSVSAPVFDDAGVMRYALTTIGFFRKTSTEDFRKAVEHTLIHARRLSSALGYRES